jgi:hypothetical protein
VVVRSGGLLILAIAVVARAGTPVPHDERYANGQLKVRGAHLDGRPHGLRNGQRARVLHYREGALHGEEEARDETGRLLYRRTWHRGRLP